MESQEYAEKAVNRPHLVCWYPSGIRLFQADTKTVVSLRSTTGYWLKLLRSNEKVDAIERQTLLSFTIHQSR